MAPASCSLMILSLIYFLTHRPTYTQAYVVVDRTLLANYFTHLMKKKGEGEEEGAQSSS